MLEHARILDRTILEADSVGLLSKVELTNLANNAKMAYMIVSPHEADIKEGKMSIKSPIAQALTGKKAGDTVTVKVPAGTMQLHIDSVTL